ncbi:DUF3826 domain-containing protein [uncultured Prevotella sp.]|uniref:DUF3826 domain-containing protein n=1 Tax=uncultured Prevotella sp. TaxID=159272 RepID=UPI00261340A2|nr:DUF3826 domain-containing protein [uncultured Prevotella sp.]
MKKFFIIAAAMMALYTTDVNAVELDSNGRDPKYVETIMQRSKKVTDALNISGTEKGEQVLNIVANRYFKLNDIYAERDSLKAVAKTMTGDEKKQKMEYAEMQKDQKLYKSHFGFIADLSVYLTDAEVETVKDVLTYNVVNVTYKAQCDMIPTLKEEEKVQILAWLKEGREYAIDAESSKKKHEAFGKYKGRINNWLSKRGYNLTKEREEWAKRVKARGETL